MTSAHLGDPRIPGHCQWLAFPNHLQGAYSVLCVPPVPTIPSLSSSKGGMRGSRTLTPSRFHEVLRATQEAGGLGLMPSWGLGFVL